MTNNIDARIGVKRAPDCKIISIDRGNTDYEYETFMNHLDNLHGVYESLIDEESRRTFRGYWHANISRQISELVYSNSSHYVTTGFSPKPGDIFIDVGTCDGGTVLKFLNFGCKVYGFEMDKINYERSKKLADEKGFIVENLGLGSYDHEIKYTHVEENIAASHVDANGTETAKIVKLDNYVSENKLPRVDFIKLDVEGAELDVLQGAADTIARFEPILAISAYHKWDDFWVLMNFVKSIRPDYEFALRQYAETREDVPFMFENGLQDLLVSLGLEPNARWYNECVLLAR